MRKAAAVFFLMTLVLFLFPGTSLYSQSRGLRIRIKNLDSVNEVGKQYLVLIAINRYRHWTPLKGPKKDAEDIREILESRYYVDEVLKLYDEEATKGRIIELLKQLQNKLKQEDSVFIFYAGHGHLDKASKNGFWIPVDGGLNENVQERWIPNSIIRGLISQMKSKHILLISDSCFSGDLLEAWREKTPAITHEYFKRAYKRRSRQALTSGASERVPDNSEFSIQLKLALEENDKPYLDPLSIYNEIRWGIKGTLPMFGYLNGTNHQEGGAFLFFLKEEREDKPAHVKAVESKALRVYKNNNGYWEADYGDGIVMVYIPEGKFTMGQTDEEKKWLIDQFGENMYNLFHFDETPLHTVHLDGYWMGKTEVTVKQFRVFVNAKSYKTQAETDGGAYQWDGNKWEKKKDLNWKNPGYKQDDNHPVVCVSWNDADAYCKWLSDKKGLNFKLPTEARWEKAARGINGRKYPWGDHGPYYNEKWYANFAANDSWDKRGDDGFEYTAPVGSYTWGESPYGLMDMAGNVWEWCYDWYGRDYYKKSPDNNPTGPKDGAFRVIRGGSWLDNACSLRCADRRYDRPSGRNLNVGFRLCQDH